MMSYFCLGTNISSTQIEIPAWVAKRKPFCNNLSANTTVSFNPHLRKEVLIKREISFFLRARLILSKGIPFGKISLNNERPTVVSRIAVLGINSFVTLSREYSVKRILMRVVISTTPASRARRTSLVSAKVIPSPTPLMRSRVA